MLYTVLLIVFSKFVRFDVPNYNLHLLLGIIMWDFLRESSQNGLNTFILKSALVKKMYFPRIILVLASTWTAILGFILNLIVFFTFLFYFGGTVSWSSFIFLFYFISFYFLVLGISLGLSVLYVKFRDLSHIWEVALQIGMWATPIIYPLAIVPQKYHQYLFLNPITRLVEGSREVLIMNQTPSLTSVLITGLFCFSVFIIGYLIFQKLEADVAENV